MKGAVARYLITIALVLMCACSADKMPQNNMDSGGNSSASSQLQSSGSSHTAASPIVEEVIMDNASTTFVGATKNYAKNVAAVDEVDVTALPQSAMIISVDSSRHSGPTVTSSMISGTRARFFYNVLWQSWMNGQSFSGYVGGFPSNYYGKGTMQFALTLNKATTGLRTRYAINYNYYLGDYYL